MPPEPMREPCSILLVDDDAILRQSLGRAFESRGYDVRLGQNYDEAVAQATRDSPEWAVLDLNMPGHSGLRLLEELLRIDPATRVVMLTGYGSIATAVDAMRLGAASYVPKPADADDIIAAFARAALPPGARLAGAGAAPAPSLARVEWEHIQRVLQDCDNNITVAARCLGVHRRSLQRKLHKYPPAH